MDIGDWKCFSGTFFGIETDRHPLYCTHIIYSTALIKISQCDMSCFLVYINGRDRRWDLLDQGQMLFPIFFIGNINDLL